MSVALSTDGDVVYSGASDGSIRMWQVPVDLADPFDIYGLFFIFPKSILY